MKFALPAAGCLALLIAAGAPAQDWPQWRGTNRDAKATGFTEPKTWPKELTQKWKVTVGDGVATPALVGDKLYVFTRQGGNEVIRCLNAATGDEIWQDKYPSRGASGPAQGFPGPRCSPAVADGKVVLLGVDGILSCYEANKGEKLWRNEDFKGKVPGFFTSSSPMIVDGLCIVQLGSDRNGGGIYAFELSGGKEKWKWTDDGPAYASPNLLTLGDTKIVVAETAARIVALDAAGGKLLWETPFPRGQGRSYNACTPIVDGQTLIYAGDGGRGTKAVKFEKKDDGVAVKELWSNPQSGVVYNSPLVKDGKIFGLSERDDLFCISMDGGKTAWKAPVPKATGGGGGGGGGMRGGAGYGSIVDTGSVLFALTPSGKLVAYQPSDKEFKEVASYKVGDGTYAYPVASGNRIYIKDKESVKLLVVE